MIHNAEKALQQACKLTNTEVSEYTAAPMHLAEGQKAYHEWIIEFKEAPKDLSNFIYHFDNALKSTNSTVKTKQLLGAILSPAA